MKYLVLLVGDGEEAPWSSLSADEQAALMQKFGEFGAACTAREGVAILGGEALGRDRRTQDFDQPRATVLGTAQTGSHGRSPADQRAGRPDRCGTNQAPVPPGLASAIRLWLVGWLARRLG